LLLFLAFPHLGRLATILFASDFFLDFFLLFLHHLLLQQIPSLVVHSTTLTSELVIILER